jgi:RimJ/RimL family protein N-acetyltransferase
MFAGADSAKLDPDARTQRHAPEDRREGADMIARRRLRGRPWPRSRSPRPTTLADPPSTPARTLADPPSTPARTRADPPGTAPARLTTVGAIVAGDPEVLVRPVRPGDLVALDALLSSLDAQARARRWFTCAVDIHRAAAWAAHPTREGAVGLVAATAAGELVGHAALIPLDGARGEVCFEVAAAWRCHGIAGRLLAELDRQAARRGLTTIVAEVLAENSSMLAVLREHGPCHEHRDHEVVEVTLRVGLDRAGAARPAP